MAIATLLPGAVLSLITSLLFTKLPKKLERKWPALILLMISLVFVAFRSSPKHIPERSRNKGKLLPDTVALIVVDAARADDMDVFNIENETYLPALKDFAQKGVVFTNALAVSSWTAPSHAVLLSGEEFYHGTETSLSPDNDTLAKSYRESGFVTIGISANRNLRKDNGFGSGFDIFATMPENPFYTYNIFGQLYLKLFNSSIVWKHSSGRKVTRVLAKLMKRYRERPLFLFLNYMNAHDPYLPSVESLRHYEGVDGNDRSMGILREPGKTLSDFMTEKSRALSKKEIVKIRRLYRACLTDWDAEFREVLELLDKREKRDRQFVVVTSDHGELFGEYGGFFAHKNQLLENELKIPLVMGGSIVQERGTMIEEYINHAQISGIMKRILSMESGKFQLTQAAEEISDSYHEGKPEITYASAMGPSSFLNELQDERGKYSSDLLLNLLFPERGAEILFINNEAMVWRSRGDVDEKTFAAAAKEIADIYFGDSPILKHGTEHQPSKKTREVLKSLGYIK